MSSRRRFTPQFKAQVVLDVLTGTKSVAEVCREHSLKDSLVMRWKRTFLERAAQVFEGDGAAAQHEAKIAELERLTGRLTAQLEVAEKFRCILSLITTQAGSGA